MESVRSSVVPGDTALYYQDELSVQDKVMLREGPGLVLEWMQSGVTTSTATQSSTISHGMGLVHQLGIGTGYVICLTP